MEGCSGGNRGGELRSGRGERVFIHICKWRNNRDTKREIRGEWNEWKIIRHAGQVNWRASIDRL